MAKMLGKVVLFGVIAGAAAAGVYHYLQTKDQKLDEYDDFDDLDSFDDTVKEEGAESSRSYITLDTAKYFVNDTIDKAKEYWGKASEKIKKTIEDPTDVKAEEDDDVFDVIEEGMSKVVADAEAAIDDVAEKIAETEQKAEAKAEESDETEELEEIEDESSEEFFDDDEL